MTQWWSSLNFFLEPEPSFLALIIFFWSQSRVFWLWFFWGEPEPEYFGSDYFFWSQSRDFWLWLFFIGARAELFGSEFLFWSLSRSLKFSKPARALVGSLKFLLVSQDPFIGLVIAGNLLIHIGNGWVFLRHYQCNALVMVECSTEITNVMLW